MLSSVAPQAPCESLETGETLTKLRAAARAAVSSVSSLLVLGGPGDEETASGSPPTACATGAPNSANPSESACDDRGAHSGTLPSLVTGTSPAESTPAFSKSMPAVGSRASFNESVPFGAPAGSSQSENGLPRASAQLVPTSLPSQACCGTAFQGSPSQVLAISSSLGVPNSGTSLSPSGAGPLLVPAPAVRTAEGLLCASGASQGLNSALGLAGLANLSNLSCLPSLPSLSFPTSSGMGQQSDDVVTLHRELDGQQAVALVYTLAQLAEESSQMATSASAYCANSVSDDPIEATALAEAAQQAATRASWAAATLESYFPRMGNRDNEGDWVMNLKQIAMQAAEAAEHAAQTCRQHASQLAATVPPTTEKKSRVPCKWNMMGQCQKGSSCEFSHDLVDLQPRPLNKKRAEECMHFAKGQCTRGAACPFAHGPEELAEITRIVNNLKAKKHLFGRYG